MPWVLRPWTLFAANAVCFAVNWWAAGVQMNRRDQFANTCGQIVGMTGPVTVAVIVIFAVTALSIALAIIWGVKKRAGDGRVGPIIGTALFLIVFTLFNMLLAGGDVSYLSFSFRCGGS